MIRMHCHIEAIFAILLTGASSVLLGQSTQRTPACKIEITSPTFRMDVSAKIEANGTAQNPSGTYIWVFARRKGLELWWPQPRGMVREGSWRGPVYFGTLDDVGSQFEVLAAVVTDDVDRRLRAWFSIAERTGAYPPIPLPQVLCTTLVVVIRTR